MTDWSPPDEPCSGPRSVSYVTSTPYALNFEEDFRVDNASLDSLQILSEIYEVIEDDGVQVATPTVESYSFLDLLVGYGEEQVFHDAAILEATIYGIQGFRDEPMTHDAAILEAVIYGLSYVHEEHVWHDGAITGASIYA